MHHHPPRPCHATGLAHAVAVGLLDWPLRRYGFCLAVVAGLLLLRPAIVTALHCSATGTTAACRSAQ